MKAQRPTYDLPTADAVLLLDAPTRETPDIFDTSRAACSYGLLLVIPLVALAAAALIIADRLAPVLTAVPRW
jgi:hypothetical protein